MKRLTDASIIAVQRAVLSWYKQHGRHTLPWRNLESVRVDVPYGVLVSEFMLQQTQVDRVIPKYKAFIHTFPDVQTLAAATPAKVITLWSGLGYNRRAIMLHNAAKEIVAHFDGVVPHDLPSLQSLPGVGPYTAAAVASFGFNEPVVVLDTNIERFYELLFYGYEKPALKEIYAFAERFLPKQNSQAWHAALMDLMSSLRNLKSPHEQQDALLEDLDLKPTWSLPKLSDKPLVRPKQSTFKQSQRYYRGQIIAALRERPEHKMTYHQATELVAGLHMPAEYSLNDILLKLKKDKLVVFREPLKPRSIIKLP